MAPDRGVVPFATMEKLFEGEAVGHSATLFTAAYDQATGAGTHVASDGTHRIWFDYELG